ncbi:hypothetical protein MASR1M32_02360 [Rhodobacter sp.]
MTASLPALTEALLAAARKAGADSADALAVSGQSLTVDLRLGALEQAERAEGTEIGLRVLIGRRQACVSASDISAATISALAERAVAMAREAPEDPTAGLADPSQLTDRRDAGGLDLCDPSPEPSAARLEAAARAAEAGALAAKGITQVETSATWSRREMHLAASNGFAGAMPAARIRCLPSPSAAAAPRWSATSPARAASTPPTCLRTRGSASWRRNVRWPGWVR